MSILGDAIHRKPSTASPPSAESSVQLGPRYQQMLDANPYRNQVYHTSPWQNFLSAIGFRTEADAFKENMAVQAAEYDAAIAQKAADEQYDSAAEQTARLRAAGLNPDLNGGQNVSAGEAAGLPQDPSTPMQTTGAEGALGEVASTAFQLASGCLNAVATATGIVQSVQGIRRNHLDNIMQSINNEAGLQSLADQVLPYLIPATNEGLFDEQGDLFGTWKNNAYEAAKFFTGNMPKKMRGKFESALLSRLNSAPTERKAYEEWSGRVKARKDLFREKSEFYSEEDDILRIVSEGLGQMNEKITKAMQEVNLTGAEAQTEENKNSEEYFKTLDSNLQARAENSANNVTLLNNQMVGIMRESLNSIVKDLDKASKEGGVKGGLASVAMAIISSLQLWISTQGAPSVSRSSSSSASFGPKGSVEKSSSSFSLNL